MSPFIASVPPYFLPSTAMSPRFRSPLTRIFFALAASTWASASTSSLRFNTSLSASMPARRELTRVGRVVSRLTGSLRRDLRFGAAIGEGLSGIIFLATVEISVRTSRLAWMLASRLRSKALIVSAPPSVLIAMAEVW